MTNISKELCEICEIERESKLVFKKRDWDGKTYICAGHGYKEFDFKSTPHSIVDIIPTKDYEETNGFLYPYSDIEWIKQEYDKNGYDFVEFRQRIIDFEQAENFVKLFKLITTIEKFRFTTGNFYISSIPSYKQDTALTADNEEYYSSNPDPIQAFITCVIKHCKRNKDTADYIRAEKWEY